METRTKFLNVLTATVIALCIMGFAVGCGEENGGGKDDGGKDGDETVGGMDSALVLASAQGWISGTGGYIFLFNETVLKISNNGEYWTAACGTWSVTDNKLTVVPVIFGASFPNEAIHYTYSLSGGELTLTLQQGDAVVYNKTDGITVENVFRGEIDGDLVLADGYAWILDDVSGNGYVFEANNRFLYVVAMKVVGEGSWCAKDGRFYFSYIRYDMTGGHTTNYPYTVSGDSLVLGDGVRTYLKTAGVKDAVRR